MQTSLVSIKKPSDVNVILGQTHFIKSVEDLYEALVNSVPGIKFGLAFCEASGDCLVRIDGTDKELIDLASKSAMEIGAGHSFIIFLKGAYPVNVLNSIKNVPEVCRVFAASANSLQVIVAETETGRGILGVIDGSKPVGIENEEKMRERRDFLRKIGYKK
ncbi:MAG: adenosine-specific kinase [Planctomycetota bacterium]|nr:adenosine-specific kinase [Planctomycetota bacterium]